MILARLNLIFMRVRLFDGWASHTSLAREKERHLNPLHQTDKENYTNSPNQKCFGAVVCYRENNFLQVSVAWNRTVDTVRYGWNGRALRDPDTGETEAMCRGDGTAEERSHKNQNRYQEGAGGKRPAPARKRRRLASPRSVPKKDGDVKASTRAEKSWPRSIKKMPGSPPLSNAGGGPRNRGKARRYRSGR